MFEARRQNLSEAVAEVFDGIVRKSRQQDVIYFSGLFRNRGNDSRVAVAMEIHPPRGNAINQLPAVIGIEINAFGFGDSNRRRVQRLLRERMPNLKVGIHK